MTAIVRPLEERDLEACRQVHRAAFAAFIGLDDPSDFRPGADAIAPRWRAWPEGCLALEEDGEILASALMMHWGSVCILGPLTVAPKAWSRGLARQLMDRLIEIVDEEGFAFTGLFTHVHSTKHVRLYERYGFHLQRVVAVMSKPAGEGKSAGDAPRPAAVDDLDRDVAAAAKVTGAIYPGLDLGREIREVAQAGLGETILISEDKAPAGVAICHHGPGSEASEGQLLVKFAAVTPGPGAGGRFDYLLAACEDLAASRGATRIVAGTNAGRGHAYAAMKAAGFRADMNGIAMLRPATDGYNTAEVWAIDDWR